MCQQESPGEPAKKPKITFAEAPKPADEVQYVSPPKTQDRHENAEGKKRCGMCGFKAQGKWVCTYSYSYACPVNDPFLSCNGFASKVRPSKPVQDKPPRLSIPEGVRFLYFGRPRQGERHQGVMTVAYRINPERHEVEIGFAFCSPLDAYNKDRGRSIALDRLKVMVIRAPYLYQPRRVLVEIVQALMTHDFQTAAQVCRAFPSSLVRNQVPSWTKDLAQHPKLQTYTCLTPQAKAMSKLVRGWFNESASVSPEAMRLLDRMIIEGSPVIHRIHTSRRVGGPFDVDRIMARMITDILNLDRQAPK